MPGDGMRWTYIQVLPPSKMLSVRDVDMSTAMSEGYLKYSDLSEKEEFEGLAYFLLES